MQSPSVTTGPPNQPTDVIKSFGTGLTNPDFVAFAESFGLDGYRPTAPAEVRDACGEALSCDKIADRGTPVKGGH